MTRLVMTLSKCDRKGDQPTVCAMQLGERRTESFTGLCYELSYFEDELAQSDKPRYSCNVS